MTKKLSTLLLIALMLALPLRAVAGVAMAACMAHHGSSIGMQMDHQQAFSSDACHEADGMQSCEQDDGAPVHQANASCSACGDCCVGVISFPMGSQSIFSQDLSPVLASFTDQPYPGFHPEGPDRPPRHTFS